MTLKEIVKLFEEKFPEENLCCVGKYGCRTDCGKKTKEEFKQFWLEHIRALLESVKMESKTFPNMESDDFDAGYNQAVEEINNQIQFLLSEGKGGEK